MRITNKIMQNNNLANINTNKIYQDALSTQMSTQKKISRPSDDPVVAIRALRLRSNVNEVTQYYSKNIPDAESWLSVTEDALKNLTEIVTNMISQCTKGSNGDLTSEDRKIILEQLQALGDEVYTTGDADYAGRYVFTGYRTNISLSFLKAEDIPYSITEQLDSSAIGSVNHIDTGKLQDINSANYNTADLASITEQDVSSLDVYRIRLAYSDCSGATKPSISFAGTTWGDADITIVNSHSNPYGKVTADDDAIVYVPETGELLLGKNRYQEIMQAKDDPATVTNEGEIRVTYEKSSWEKGDLRPEHYFACTTNKGTADEISYNSSYLAGNVEKQAIEYDVGFNQTIRVNSTADECFQHGIGRETDDLVSSMEEVEKLEKLVSDLEGILATAQGTDAETVQKQLDAANKALTLSKNKGQKLFEKAITTFQGYLDSANLCITNCGTRSSKLELIENRMKNQKTTFETLKSENEDVDITEVAIQLSSAELTYEAALMATGKVMQTTLLNFI